MTIYLDLIILANFLIDFCIISYTGIIANEKINYLRIVLSTLFAVTGLTLFFVKILWIFFILRIIYGLGIIYIAFPFINMKKYLKNIVIFYIINFITAGFIISFDFQFTNNIILVDLNKQVTWYILLFSFILANILTYIYKVIEENNAKLKTCITDIRFTFCNKDYQVKGLIDSGNLVTSLGDNLPIVFIEKTLFSFDITENYLINNDIKFTYVIFKTIKHEDLILAFMPDSFAVLINNRYEIKNVYIALSKNIKNKDQAFYAVLNANILI